MTSATDKTDRRRRATGSEAFVIKSASIDGLALVLKTTDLATLDAELRQRFAGTALAASPLVFDLSALDPGAPELRLGELVELVRPYRLQPVAITGASGGLLDEALALGLGDLTDAGYTPPRPVVDKRAPAPSPAPTPEQLAQIDAERRQAIDAAVNQAINQAVNQAVTEALATRTAPTMVVTRPLRSGQRVYAQGGDLIVCGMVSHGAEVLADGHVHVYGPLRGRAVAGARGNIAARIFTSCMEPDLYAIAGIYNTTDIPLAKEIQGKPAQVRLDGERLIVEPLKV